MLTVRWGKRARREGEERREGKERDAGRDRPRREDGQRDAERDRARARREGEDVVAVGEKACMPMRRTRWRARAIRLSLRYLRFLDTAGAAAPASPVVSSASRDQQARTTCQ